MRNFIFVAMTALGIAACASSTEPTGNISCDQPSDATLSGSTWYVTLRTNTPSGCKVQSCTFSNAAGYSAQGAIDWCRSTVAVLPSRVKPVYV